MVNSHSFYNIILSRPTVDTFGVVFSTLHLTMKYHMDNRWVGAIRGHKEVATKCYQDKYKKGHEHISLSDLIRMPGFFYVYPPL